MLGTILKTHFQKENFFFFLLILTSHAFSFEYLKSLKKKHTRPMCCCRLLLPVWHWGSVESQLMSLSAAYILFLSKHGLNKIDFVLKWTMSHISIKEKLELNCNHQSRSLCRPPLKQQNASLYVTQHCGWRSFISNDCGVICNLDALLWNAPPSAANKC